MLNRVPQKVREASRLVVLRHPNSMPCAIFRKRLNRVDDPAGTEGGEPTLGGMGVLDSVDEADYDWDYIGDGHILFGGVAEPAGQTDRDDALVQQPIASALIEPSDETLVANPAFIPDKHDVIYALPGEGVHLPFEIVDVEGTVHVPPYTRRYALNARDELAYLGADVPAELMAESDSPDLVGGS